MLNSKMRAGIKRQVQRLSLGRAELEFSWELRVFRASSRQKTVDVLLGCVFTAEFRASVARSVLFIYLFI